MSGTAPAAEVRRDEQGRWLCNAVVGCDQPAVLQWAYPEPVADDPNRTVPVFGCADHE